MQEVVATGVHFPSRRHARHAADIVVVESDGSLRKAREIRRKGPVATVVGQHVTIQRVVHHHYGFHGVILWLCSIDVDNVGSLKRRFQEDDYQQLLHSIEQLIDQEFNT